MIITSTTKESFGTVTTDNGKIFCVDLYGDVYLRTNDGMTRLNALSMTLSEMNQIRGLGLFEFRKEYLGDNNG